MWLKFLPFLIISCLSCSAIPRGEAKAQLRSLARMPRMDLQYGLSFDPLTGFSLLTPVADPSEELDKLRRDLANDPTDAASYIKLGRVYDSLRDSNKAYAAYLKAVDLARRESELDPGNGSAASELAVALS